MPDYRQEFYTNYHIAVGVNRPPSLAEYNFVSRQFLGRWKKWLPSEKKAQCLDLGCGSGEFLYFLLSQGYSNVYGVDLNSVEIARGQQMGLANVECGNLFDYLAKADKENHFDLISAFNLFEHLKKEEVLSLLKLVYRTLKPGGKLLAVTPNGLSPFSGATRYHDFSHETGFTPAAWRQLAKINGFQQSIFEEMGPIPHSIKGKIRVALWQLIKLGIIGINYVELATPRDASKVYTSDMKIVLVK
jgi:SAM-dependent methyltransferase